MAHHSRQGMDDEIRRALGLGATGDYPQGRLTAHDEGGLRLAVGTKDGKVVMDFGKPVAWIGLDAEQAVALADSLREKAQEVLDARKEPR